MRMLTMLLIIGGLVLCLSGCRYMNWPVIEKIEKVVEEEVEEAVEETIERISDIIEEEISEKDNGSNTN